MHLTRVVPLLLCASLILRAQAAAAQSPDLRGERISLLAADAELARKAAAGETNAANAVVPALRADAVLFVPRSAPLTTANDIAAWLKSDTVWCRASISWRAVRADVSADGRDGYTYGYVDMKMQDGSPRAAKYLAYWRKDSTDGNRWKLLAYRRNPRPPGEPAPVPQGFTTPTDSTGLWFKGGTQDAVATIIETDKTFARFAQEKGGATAAFERYLAADGATLGGDTSIAYGPKRAGAEFSSFAPGTLDWEPQHVVASRSGDLGFAVGPVKVRDPGQPQRIVGFYLTVWKRQADGSWRVVIDG